MTEFEAQVKAAAEKAVLHYVSSGGWLLPNVELRRGAEVPNESAAYNPSPRTEG